MRQLWYGGTWLVTTLLREWMLDFWAGKGTDVVRCDLGAGEEIFAVETMRVREAGTSVAWKRREKREVPCRSVCLHFFRRKVGGCFMK